MGFFYTLGLATFVSYTVWRIAAARLFSPFVESTRICILTKLASRVQVVCSVSTICRSLSPLMVVSLEFTLLDMPPVQYMWPG